MEWISGALLEGSFENFETRGDEIVESRGATHLRSRAILGAVVDLAPSEFHRYRNIHQERIAR